ncbi:MAG: secretin N-terminal domain-containing protein, partial [Planctomycetota bacterium]
ADVTDYPNMSTLLISGESGEVARAQIILDLVDSPEQFVIEEILPVSAARNMPSNDQIAAKLHPSLTKGVSIGNFTNPPRKDATTRAIIDIHNNAVIAIAPAKLLERIVSVVGPSPRQDPVKTQDKPIAQEKAQAPANRTVAGLLAPNEAKFQLAADGAAKAQPKTGTPKTQPSSTAIRTESSGTAATPPADTTVGKVDREVPVSADAGETVASASVPNGDEIVNLALADFEKLTIVQFLGLVGPYLQLDFMYDPKMLTSEVTISPNGKWRGPIKVRDLYPMLEEVLKFNNLVMTRSEGNLVTIVPVAEALTIDPALVDAYDREIERGDGVLTRVFDLEHVDTASAINLLTSMRLTVAPPIPKGKAIIVTGYAHRMPRIQALLDIIDKPGDEKKFRFRQLRYTMAETLAPKLQTLAEQLGTVSITVTQTSPSTTTPTTSAPKRSTETTAQYQARLRSEAAARARARSAAARTPTAAKQPDAEKPTVYLDSDERTNRILMIGLDEQLDKVEELIDTLDVVQQDLRTLELYKVEHVAAEEVKNKLEELGIITPRMTSPYSSRITSGVKPPTATTAATRTGTTTRPTTTSRSQMYGDMEEIPGEEPQVVVVEQTNSLLVNATAEQHEKIARILSYVDSEMSESDIPVQLYPLENQSPEHLAEILEKLIQDTFKDPESKIEKTVAKRPDEEMPIIVPEPNTFSLIVYASKNNQEWIGNIIESLDKRRPQVLIDVTLVQISKSDAFDYDLNILSSFPDLVETAGVTGAIMGGAGEGASLVSTLLDSDRDRFVDFQSQGGRGTGFYGDKHINALLTAMHAKDYGRILAKPKILVNDNETGMISSTDKTYVTTQGSTIVQGQSGAVQTSVDFEEYDAGITLDITPHISSGDLLRLDILLTRSDFGTITGDKPPDTQLSDIDTTVTIPDGSTIILGGLIKLNQSKGGTKIPILGDIPLIGGLFRSASNSDLQRSLYIFVKAEIIRPSESGLAQADLERISERNRTAFEEHETEFQEYHDWAGIKSKPMKPLKVLDAQ